MFRQNQSWRQQAGSSNPSGDLGHLIADHQHQLAQLAGLVGTMDAIRYMHREPPNDSIGAHVRHLLEHYECLLNPDNGVVDYDQRPRNQVLESCRNTALKSIQGIRQALPQIASGPVHIRYLPAAASEDALVVMASSIERELLFLISHTIHHMALIALFARRAGLSVPADFGVTPSTSRYRAGLVGTTSAES